MDDNKPKREVPSELKKILEFDVKLSKDLVERVNQLYPIATYRYASTQLYVYKFFFRAHLKSLEVSCHGIPWLMLAIAGIYVTNLKEASVNLLIGLVLDIVIVAVLKAFTRRRRPAYDVDDQVFTASRDLANAFMIIFFKVATVKMVDKFSFPSGHATRATMLALLFTLLSPLPFLLWIPFLAWAAAVAVSRVLLGRHHILDVVAGVIIGVAEAVILSMLWRSEEEVASKDLKFPESKTFLLCIG